MNNKIVAIVLSVVAVIVVIYQIFLREDEDLIKKNRRGQFVKTNTGNTRHTPPPSVSENNIDNINGTEMENTSSGMIIDLYSPELLKRVKPYIENSFVELSGDFGKNILGYKKIKKEEKTEASKEKKMPILTLNGIIEVIKDKITIAIINNRLYRKGEIVENAVVQKIEKYKVFLKFNEETIILTIDHGTYKGWIKKKIGGNS